MGQLLLLHLDGDKIYTCSVCQTHLATRDTVMSKVGGGVGSWKLEHWTPSPSERRPAPCRVVEGPATDVDEPAQSNGWYCRAS